MRGYEKLLNSWATTRPCCLRTPCIRPMRRGLSAAGRRAKRSSRSSRRAGVNAINIHGAIDLETGQTRMIEALTIDAASTIRLLQWIEALYPMLALIHVFLDNARYHHAKLVQEWLRPAGTTHQAALHPNCIART